MRPEKFYPPLVDTPQFLYRERTVDAVVRNLTPEKTTIVFQAQAGQGKTTVVKQLLNRLGAAFAWYQVGPEDADPAYFLVAIRACIAGAVPHPPLDGEPGGLTGGELAPQDLPKRIDVLLADLRRRLRDDLFLVFDDLHNLAAHQSSLFILDYLLEHAPPRLRFILASREPLPLKACSPQGQRRRLDCGNSELALDDAEIADFFQRVLELPLSHDAVRQIASRTDGWVMGVLLLGLKMAKSQGLVPPTEHAGAERTGMLGFFRNRIFDPLETRLHRPLEIVSLLEEIPVELAQSLTGVAHIGQDLAVLARRNVFVRALNKDSTLFGLHHLFREFLREKARDELPPGLVRDIRRQAGRFYFHRADTAQALRYLLPAEDHSAMEAVLHKGGPAMLAANQTATLAAILDSVPGEVLTRLGWTPFYLALARLDFAPAQALPLLSQALQVFRERGDELGEMLCLAHSIAIHITTTGHYRQGEELLARAETLFARTARDLDPTTTIQLSGSLAMGRCIFLADSAKATQYALQGLSTAKSRKLVNFEAALFMVLGYTEIFAGRFAQALPWLERAALAAHRPEVGTFNCLSIRMMLFNFVFHDGQFDNYFDQKNRLIEAIGAEMVSQSIAGPFCYIWEMDIAINQGRPEDACALARQALALHPPLSPHLRSMVLQGQAAALALLGQGDRALSALDESAALRRQAGGPYFIVLNTLMAGLTHGFLGDADRAVDLLTSGIEGARAMPTPYLEACGLLHRGGAHLRRGDTKSAGQDIARGLGLMRTNTYRHFWAWAPQAALPVLGFAAAQRLEADYARTLAAQRFDTDLTDGGDPVALVHFTTLGGLTIHRGGVEILAAQSLTPAQRELFCMLLAAPGLKLDQETLQLHFWPDSPPAAAKIKFDTMVSRLRKTLAEALPAASPGLLHRDKGILWLAHCRTDTEEFLEAAAHGLEHLRRDEFWQASNAFSRAEALWGGDFVPGVTGEDRIRAFRDTLSAALTRMALAWSDSLALFGREQHALDLTEKALRADPLNDALWTQLYRLHGRRSAIRARQVLQRLKKLLRDEDYPETEIAEMLERIAHAR